VINERRISFGLMLTKNGTQLYCNARVNARCTHVKRGDVIYMSDDALKAIENRQKTYFQASNSNHCKLVLITARKMNLIPTPIFCERLPNKWNQECLQRIKGPPLYDTATITVISVMGIILITTIALSIFCVSYFLSQEKKIQEKEEFVMDKRIAVEPINDTQPDESIDFHPESSQTKRKMSNKNVALGMPMGFYDEKKLKNEKEWQLE